MRTNLLIYLCLYFIIERNDGLEISTLSHDAAFIKYEKNPNIKEIIFKEPLNEKLKLNALISGLQITKELEKSKYKSTVFVDKQRLYMQSNLDKENFTVNSICNFDHEQLAVHTFHMACCHTTMKLQNVLLDQKVCKFEIGTTTSVCFQQWQVAKKLFDFTQSNEFELIMTSRVFMSGDSKCSTKYIHGANLAQGLPQKIIVRHGLQVKWTLTDQTTLFGDLEIGVPVDSIEFRSRTIFALRIQSVKPIVGANIECSYGSDLVFTAISFEGTQFGGEFVSSKDDRSVKIDIQIDGRSSSNWNSGISDNLVNLEMTVSSKSMEMDPNAISKWISCKVKSAKFYKSKLTNIRDDNEAPPKKVHYRVNTDGFIMIPIATEKTYFSILNEISGPIELQKSDLQVYNVFSTVNEGSFVEVTDKTVCNPISNSSITCPSSKATNNVKTVLKDPNWNILLSMNSWQKLITYPMELWNAEDWRAVVQDKILNQIKNWEYYDRNSKTCRPMYQVSRCQLLARLVEETIYTKKVYFGQRNIEEFPLFDLTQHLSNPNILMSNQHIRAKLKNSFILLSPKSLGESDISILNNKGKKLAFDRIEVSKETVSLVDIEISCIYTLNVTQTTNSFNPSFRSIIFRSQPSRTTKESCYIRINLVFSDNSVTNLQDYLFSDFQIMFRTQEGSITIPDLDSFLYQPEKYKEPGKFSISIFESKKCTGNRLIFEKVIDIYKLQLPSKELERETVTTPILTFPLVNHTKIIPPETTKIVSSTKEVKNIDTDSLFLSMKILIGLVALVVLIVILNCVIKIRQRKSVRLIDGPLNHSSAYTPIEKLTNSTYLPADLITQNPQHPPLLPPPGPLYNASDSSQLDLTVNATPDIFWGLPHGGESMGRQGHMTFQMNQINGYQNMHLQNRKTSSSPHGDNLDYGFIIANTNKLPNNSQNIYNFPPESNQDTDSVATGSSGKNCSQIAMNVPPPCPPLRWNNNFCSNQFSMYYPCATDVVTEPSHHSHDNSSQNSLAQSHASSWEIKQKPVLPPSAFTNSIDNVCEKSSGVGSLTSTKPESDCSKKDSGCPSSPKTTNYSIIH